MRYIYPPRPKGKMHPRDLPIYESSGRWVAQRKFGGTRTMVRVGLDGELDFLNRHGSRQERVRPHSGIVESLRGLRLARGKEHLLDGEMIRGEKSTLVLFDLLVLDGAYLFGKPDQLTRLQLLSECCGPGKSSDLGILVGDGLVVAECWGEGFVARFSESSGMPNVEGLVLRKKSSGLDNYGAAEYETTSQIRCRKPLDTHYNF